MLVFFKKLPNTAPITDIKIAYGKLTRRLVRKVGDQLGLPMKRKDKEKNLKTIFDSNKTTAQLITAYNAWLTVRDERTDKAVKAISKFWEKLKEKGYIPANVASTVESHAADLNEVIEEVTDDDDSD